MTSTVVHRLTPRDLVRGLQVEVSNRLAGSRSNLCAAARGLWISGLSAGRLFAKMYRPEPLSAHRCAVAEDFATFDGRSRERVVPVRLIQHSDRGRQYCSNVYDERLLEVGVTIGMSTPGQTTENTFASSLDEDTLCVRRRICTFS